MTITCFKDRNLLGSLSSRRDETVVASPPAEVAMVVASLTSPSMAEDCSQASGVSVAVSLAGGAAGGLTEPIIGSRIGSDIEIRGQRRAKEGGKFELEVFSRFV